jgi:glycosyltransferase involved in cell wall biosynthesis
MNHPLPLTAAIITHNEAANLAELLPLLDFCREIVIVDSDSHDATTEVARPYARVVRHPLANFAQQRNLAIMHATQPWILSIDADERPIPAFRRELARLIPRTSHSAFHVPIRSTIFNRRFRFSGTQDDRPLRLFRRDRAHWIGAVHERLNVQGTVAQLESHLEHRTLPDLPAFLAKMRRYTSLEAAARVGRGQQATWRQFWLAPPREVFRRLIWKQGWLDGPQGWAFAALSGFSEWILARELLRIRRND